ncbi:hypothetical protein B0H14DRAFT_2565371 [Mycena olivaceomarginata]|nr:hypothetical protein B0H14DRAFT_2565371 [Mycena olivaceomarginata]
MVENFFGDPDRARRSKEVKFNQDLEALVSEVQHKFHKISTTPHFVPAPPKKPSKKPLKNPSRIAAAFCNCAEQWDGKFREFIKSTTYDPALGGYPPVTSLYAGTTRDNTLDTNTVSNNVKENPLTTDTPIDLHSSEELKGVTGSLGGGGDFDGPERWESDGPGVGYGEERGRRRGVGVNVRDVETLAGWGVRRVSGVGRRRAVVSRASEMSESTARSHAMAFRMCFDSIDVCVKKVSADATSFSNCLGGRCFPLTDSKSAEFCEATVPGSERTDVGDDGRDGGSGREWINSGAYLRIRGSHEPEARHFDPIVGTPPLSAAYPADHRRTATALHEHSGNPRVRHTSPHGSAEKRLPRAAAIGRGGGGQPLPPQPLALPTTAPLSLMSVIRVACPAVENCHRGALGVHGNVVDLGRPPAADHVALGSAALGRGAADTPSAA